MVPVGWLAGAGVTWVIGLVWSYARRFVIASAVTLGIGFVAFQGADIAIDQMEAWIMSSVSGLPVTIYTILAEMGLGVVISYWFSALSAAVSLKIAMGLMNRVKVMPPWHAPGRGLPGQWQA